MSCSGDSDADRDRIWITTGVVAAAADAGGGGGGFGREITGGGGATGPPGLPGGVDESRSGFFVAYLVMTCCISANEGETAVEDFVERRGV